MPVTVAIQTGVVNIWSPTGASTNGTSWPPTPPRCPPSKWAVSVVARTPSCYVRIRQCGGDLPWFSVMVEVRGNAEGYSGVSQALFDSFFFQLQLSFCQVEILLLLINTSPFSS